MKIRNKAVFYLNGKRQEVDAALGGMMLADYLRREKALTGTKIVCAEGDCGACTVLRYFPLAKRNHFQSINSCIATVAQMDGSSLVTVDALSSGKPEDLTPVQKAMRECHGSQCGYCTPGFVMALTGLVEKKICEKKKGNITPQEAKNFLTGNLCRCTGYQPIIDAASSISIERCRSVKEDFFSAAQEKELKQIVAQPLQIASEVYRFYAPNTMKEAVRYLAKNKEARILGASTDLGVVHNKYKFRLQNLLSLHLIPEFYQIKFSKNKFTVGARITLTELRSAVEKKVPEFARFLDLFASPQIKNVATLVGNVGNASPIADTPPFLLAMDAYVSVVGPKGKRKIPMDAFYKAYRVTALKKGEIIESITFGVPEKTDLLRLVKSSQRKDLDISAVNAAFRLRIKKAYIKEARVALGGVAAIPVRLKKVEKLLQGKWHTEKTPKILRALQNEITPLSDLRGSSAFRRILVENFLKDFIRLLEERS